MNRQETALTLVRLYAAGRLSVAHLRDACWSQHCWPWLPTPPPEGLPLAEAITEYRAALDIHLLVELESLDAVVARSDDARARCRRDPMDGLCATCSGWVDELDFAVALTAHAVVHDVPARAAAGLVATS